VEDTIFQVKNIVEKPGAKKSAITFGQLGRLVLPRIFLLL